MIEEVINSKDFEKSDREIETSEIMEELRYSQEYKSDESSVINLHELNQKEMEDPRVQAMFKRFKHNNYSIFIKSQEKYELSKRTIRCNGNIYHIFKPTNCRDVEKRYQDKDSIDMTLNDFKLFTSTCWNDKNEPITNDMTKDRFQGRYKLGLDSIFVPKSSPFQIIK